ncbi:MAG TPA: AI-2E family transporter [Methanothrix sp.]|nr:AI-2E family transporter [Methanothrix sp.]
MDDHFRPYLREHKGILLIALAALILVALFFLPFLDGIILGTVFAYVGRPIRDHFRERRKLGSLLAVICIVLPLFIILGLGMLEIANQIVILAKNQEAWKMAFAMVTERSIQELPPWIKEILAGGLENAAGIIAPIASSIPVLHMGSLASMAIINFIVSIPVCYFTLVEGENFVESIVSLLPPREKEAYWRYISRIDRILSGIFIGTIYTSILGSMIAASIFYAFGLPRPFALASIVFVAGMVPFLTSWVVIIPVTAYRYYTNGIEGAAVFFFFASALIYLPSELLIRPYLVAAKSSLHPLLVVLSFLGGALVAGIGGFFLAPAIMGVIVGIYQVRQEEKADLRGQGIQAAT